MLRGPVLALSLLGLLATASGCRRTSPSAGALEAGPLWLDAVPAYPGAREVGAEHIRGESSAGPLHILCRVYATDASPGAVMDFYAQRIAGAKREDGALKARAATTADKGVDVAVFPADAKSAPRCGATLAPSDRTLVVLSQAIGATSVGAGPVASATASPRAAAEKPLDPSLFTRDQKRSSGLVPWRAGAVTRTQPFLVVDADGAVATPLTLAGCNELLDVTSARGRDLALCAVAGGVAVLEPSADAPRARSVPVAAGRTAREPLRVATDGKRVVVWESARLLVSDGEGPFRAVPVAPPEGNPRLPGVPLHAALTSERLYLGYGRGEWGGALLSIELSTGRSRVEAAGELATEPVTGLAFDGAGSLWVTRGQSHLGASRGALHVLEAGAWRLVAGSPGKWGGSTFSKGAWNLDATAFEGVGFDAAGTLYMTSGSLGLVKRGTDGGFAPLTRGWPSWVYLAGLVVRGTTALVGTFDGGVLLVDLPTGGVRRVPLGPP